MPDSNNSVRTERRKDIRFVGSVNGHYTLASRRNGATGGAQVFACRVQSISPLVAVLSAPVCGEQNEAVTAHLEELGILRGEIIRPIEGGFAIAIAASEDERLRLAAKIDWVKRHRVRALLDKREYRRSHPRNPRTVLTLDDGSMIVGFIIDMSRSGVAVSADIAPKPGARMTIGCLHGQVVRQLDVGFAVQFAELQPAEGLEAAMRTPPAAIPAVPQSA